MTLILLTMAVGALLLAWLALTPPKLNEGHYKPRRVILTRYLPSNELTEDTE